MIEGILWNEDMDTAYGEKNNFENKQKFIEKVSNSYLNMTGSKCLVSEVRLKSCVCTVEGLDEESITPLEETDIEIKNFYIVDIERIEE